MERKLTPIEVKEYRVSLAREFDKLEEQAKRQPRKEVEHTIIANPFTLAEQISLMSGR